MQRPDGCGYITPDGHFAIKSNGWDFATRYQGFGQFSEWLAVVNQGDYKAGFIDKTGRFKIPITFKAAEPFSEGLAAIQVGKLWCYIRPNGVFAIKPRFTHAYPFVDGLALVDTGPFYSYINTTGDVVLDDVFRIS